MGLQAALSSLRRQEILPPNCIRHLGQPNLEDCSEQTVASATLQHEAECISLKRRASEVTPGRIFLIMRGFPAILCRKKSGNIFIRKLMSTSKIVCFKNGL